MIKKCLLILSVLFTGTIITHAAAYSTGGTLPGNGANGFDGAVGLGSLNLTDDGTTISGTITNGNTVSGFNDDLVLYIDSVSGGFTTTSGFTDTGGGSDTGRKSISAFDGTNRETINLPIAADYAVFLGPQKGQFGGIWQLVNGGSHQFITAALLNPTSSTAGSASTYTFSVPVTSIGLTANSGATFGLVATYLDGNSAYLSNETYGATTGLGSSDPGNGGSVTLTGGDTYTIVPEPATISLLLGSSVLGGFYLLRRRRS